MRSPQAAYVQTNIPSANNKTSLNNHQYGIHNRRISAALSSQEEVVFYSEGLSCHGTSYVNGSRIEEGTNTQQLMTYFNSIPEGTIESQRRSMISGAVRQNGAGEEKQQGFTV